MAAVDAMTEAELRERIAALEVENKRLRGADAAPPTVAGPRARRRGGLARSFASALCIILATVLIPAGVVAGWAKVRLVDETAFVMTFAPLASDAAVQTEITRQVTDLIESQIDIDGLTNAVFDGVAELGLPDRAASALNLLRSPAAAGVRSMLNTGVSEFVHSELFASAWESTLRVSHKALVAAATQDSAARGAITISDRGEVAIQLGPIIQEVKTALSNSGFGLASSIPVIEASFVVAQSDALPLISLIYGLTTALGWWLPIVALGLFVLGVLVANRKSAAIVGSGIGMLIGGAVFLIVLGVGSVILQASAPGMGVSTAAVSAVFEQTVAGMRTSASVLVVLGIIVTLLGLSQGHAQWATRSRGALERLNDRLRVKLASAGFTTGGFGRWLAHNRTLTAVVVLILAILALLVLPFTTAAVIWVAVVALVVWWALALCEAPKAAETAAEAAAVAEAAAETAQAAAETAAEAAAEAAETTAETTAETKEITR